MDTRTPQTRVPQNGSAATAVDGLKENIAAAYDTVSNGPVAQNVKNESAKTTAEMSNLASARHTPSYHAATGQPLTHYHSFFSELLSWNNPRASSIAYATIVSLIFAVRYLDIFRWTFKLTWMVLAITIAAETAGKFLMNNGFATQLRPRKYYTIPKETLNAAVGDVHELINFFVIEAQRILFAENIATSVLTAFAAFIAYYLVKIVPYWGLAVISTTVVFFTPLIYTTNQELIDSQLKHAGDVVNAQASQIRSVAQKHTEHATHITKQYMGDYTAKAQSLIATARGNEVNSHDFPSPPKEPVYPAVPKDDIRPAAAKTDLQAEQQPLI